MAASGRSVWREQWPDVKGVPMRKPTRVRKIEAGRYRVGNYLIVDEKRYQDRQRGWRVWRVNYEVTLNTRAHREGAETELEALPTLKKAVAYVVEQMEFEEAE